MVTVDFCIWGRPKYDIVRLDQVPVCLMFISLQINYRSQKTADVSPLVANSGGFQFRSPRVPGQVERQRHVTQDQIPIT